MFGQFLANKHAAPTSIKNYISGARTWIEEHRGDNRAFHSHQFSQILKGFVKNSTHIPRQAPPLTVRHIKLICSFLDGSNQVPLSIKPAILIGYSCFLRASNLFVSTMLEWAGPHTLLAGDNRVLPSGLSVIIRSTKTRNKSHPLIFEIPKGSEGLTCPLRAWLRYQQVVKPPPFGPAFISSTGLPVTSRQVVALMRIALQLETDIDYNRVSLHSLRRGATQTSWNEESPLNL